MVYNNRKAEEPKVCISSLSSDWGKTSLQLKTKVYPQSSYLHIELACISSTPQGHSPDHTTSMHSNLCVSPTPPSRILKPQKINKLIIDSIYWSIQFKQANFVTKINYWPLRIFRPALITSSTRSSCDAMIGAELIICRLTV